MFAINHLTQQCAAAFRVRQRAPDRLTMKQQFRADSNAEVDQYRDRLELSEFGAIVSQPRLAETARRD